MMSLFRRMLHSKVGVVITFIVLILIAILFGLGDVSGLRHSGSTATGDEIARVGKVTVSEPVLADRVRNEFQAFQAQQPGLDMAKYIAGGGFDGTLERYLTTLALDQFGQSQGMIVSKRLVDGQIASIPQLQDASGKFSQQLYDRALEQRRMTDAQVRDDLTRGMMAQQLSFAIDQHGMFPATLVHQVPLQVAMPYASMALEKREGQIAFVPSAVMGKGAPPTDAEVADYYKRNLARYTIAERRILRYATISPETVKAQATPSDAEIAKVYQQDGAKYQASEKRSVVQVVLLDQNAANAIAAKVKAGGSIEDAARAIGLEAAKIDGVDKTAYARQTSPEIANAVFSATKGTVLGPLRSPLGWTVARLDTITTVSAKSLDQARPEIVKALTAQKSVQAMGAIHDALDDALSNNATFDEIVSDQKLAAQTTPALLVDGANPDNPTVKPDPALAQVIAAGFQAEEGDAPQLVQTGADGTFAVVALNRIVPAAPRPLAQIRDAVAQDFSIDRAKRGARQIAGKIADAAGKGISLGDAVRAAKPGLPPVKPMVATRQQLGANLGLAKGPLVLLFSMNAKTAKVYEAPQNSGWYVVYLDHIQPGDARGNAALVNATRSDLEKAVSGEYLQQFSEAVRRAVGTTKNAAAIQKVRDQLSGQVSSDQP